jgi:hypothetical protein
MTTKKTQLPPTHSVPSRRAAPQAVAEAADASLVVAVGAGAAAALAGLVLLVPGSSPSPSPPPLAASPADITDAACQTKFQVRGFAESKQLDVVECNGKRFDLSEKVRPNDVVEDVTASACDVFEGFLSYETMESTDQKLVCDGRTYRVSLDTQQHWLAEDEVVERPLEEKS